MGYEYDIDEFAIHEKDGVWHLTLKREVEIDVKVVPDASYGGFHVESSVAAHGVYGQPNHGDPIELDGAEEECAVEFVAARAREGE